MADVELEQWELVAETKEWVGPISLTADGTPTTAFQVSLATVGRRPTVWVDPTTLEGMRGVLVGIDTDFPLRTGYRYTIYGKYADTPEQPVVRIGTVRVV